MSSDRLIVSSSSWPTLDFWALMAELNWLTRVCNKNSSRSVNEAAQSQTQMQQEVLRGCENYLLASRKRTKYAHWNDTDVPTEIKRKRGATGHCDKCWHSAVWSLTCVDTQAAGQKSLRLLISRNLGCLNKNTLPAPYCSFLMCECVWTVQETDMCKVQMTKKNNGSHCAWDHAFGIRIGQNERDTFKLSLGALHFVFTPIDR